MAATKATMNNEPTPAKVRLTEGLGPVVSIRVKRELFRFESQQEWVNKGKSWYANCGVRQGHYITVDAAGHVLHMGKCFMAATKQGLYPVAVYELQTNWA